jgi:ABC-type branched-subunit amino acid transport system substrate-binding protein
VTEPRRFLGLAAAVTLVISACGSAATPVPSAVATTGLASPIPSAIAPASAPASVAASPSGAAAPSLDLKYGVLVGLTGAVASSGQAWNQTVITAVDYIQQTVQSMGLADQLKVSMAGSEDSQGDATVGIEAAKKLADIDKANIVVGDLYSGVTIAAFQSVFQPGKILEFTGGTSPAITTMKKDNLLWRPVSSDALQGQVLAQVMGDAFGKTATVNVVARNDAYGTGLQQVFEQYWTKNGGKVGKTVVFDPTATTLDTEAQLAVQGNPDAWAFVTFCGDFAKLKGPLVRTGKWDPKKSFGSDTLQNCTGNEKIVPGMRGTEGSFSNGSSFADYQKLYESKAPSTIPFQGFASEAFDSVFLGFLAALQAGSSDPTVIGQHVQDVSGPPGTNYTTYSFLQLKDAITAILNGQKVHFTGASGPISFDANGDITVNSYIIYEAQADGSTPPIKTISFTPGS